jgi:hypothetical protein
MKKDDIDTGFTATLHRIKTACDVIEGDVPLHEDARFWLSSPYGGGIGHEFTLEDAVSEALELTGDEVRAHQILLLKNRWLQIIAIFYDGRAFTPNELIEVLK